MKKTGGKVFFAILAISIFMLAGCTKSHIVNPEPSTETSSDEGPDLNPFQNVELDFTQLDEDVRDVCLYELDYPMASDLEFEVNIDEGYVDISIIVKDGTTDEDASFYAMEVIKTINDNVAFQDYGYAMSESEYYGGLYQDNEIILRIYTASGYSSGSAPFYEITIPEDEYIPIEIGASEEQSAEVEETTE